MDFEDLYDLLDGEATILDAEAGIYCFDHFIFLNDLCLQCGDPDKLERS